MTSKPPASLTSNHPNQDDLRTKISLFPNAPGIYRMYDQKKNIIYIGKAKNLRSRVRSYFNSNLERRITQVLVSKIASIDYILTKHEKEALILENNLIKKHQPFFNIDLKDNKSYPYLWLTTHDRFPSLIKTRTLSKKGIFFGPFADVKLMNTYLEVIHLLYPLKKCRTRKFPPGFKPCLYFHIGQCLDYCTGRVNKETVMALSQEIKDLMQGKQKNVTEKLTTKINEASAVQDYERARNLKYYLDILNQIEVQQFVSNAQKNNFDVIHYHTSDHILVMVILQFRDGKLINKESYDSEGSLFENDSNDEVVLDAFEQLLFHHYTKELSIENSFPTNDTLHQPVNIQEIIIPTFFSKIHDKSTLVKKIQITINSAFSEANAPKVVSALKGKKNHYLTLAEANAKYSIQEIIRNNQKKNHAKYLKEFLKLKKTPQTIESFDIANTADQNIIAGMVRFKNGQKDKDQYRTFNIKSTNIQNDFASMEEAVYRRYKRLLEEKSPFPDLILIDGGKGQLMSAKKALDALGVKGQPIISLAKKEEEIYVPKKSEPLPIDVEHPALQFIIKVRDETHRYVNSRHVNKRDQSNLKSILSNVDGLGVVKIKTLLSQFDSLEEIKLSSVETLNRLPHFREKDARLLIDFLKGK